MSDEVFKGRCVGGPLDGTLQRCRSPWLRVARYTPTCWRPVAVESDELLRVDVVTYRHWSSKYFPDGLWLAE